MPDDIERGAVELRSKVDRESAVPGGGSVACRRRRGRGGGRRVPVAGVSSVRVVDRGAGCHIRHVESPREGVDGGTCGLVGETEQSEDSV